MGRAPRSLEAGEGLVTTIAAPVTEVVTPVALAPAEPILGLDFVAVDFETANRKRASACAIGLVRVRNGLVVKTANWLMRPPVGFDNFEQVNIDVHGIVPRDVADQLRFGQMYDRLLNGIRSEVLVAHNAAFDKGVMKAAAEAEGREPPNNVWRCTRRLTEAYVPELDNYRLPTVTAEFGVVLVNHHDAGADALAAASVMICLARRFGWTDLTEIGR